MTGRRTGTGDDGRRAETVAVGVGCCAGVGAPEVLELVRAVLLRAGLPAGRVTLLATVEARSREPGLRAAAATLGVPLRAYPAARLARERVPHPSDFAHATLGTPSVAEAAALLAAAGEETGGGAPPGDRAHGGLVHGETAHGETAHGETAHGETAHGETAHGETAHGETVRGDDAAHTGPAHTGPAHTDQRHTAPAHTDPARTDPVHGRTVPGRDAVGAGRESGSGGGGRVRLLVGKTRSPVSGGRPARATAAVAAGPGPKEAV
ncbi:cobalamin biosynthesis protein [Streptomyces cacaoi]|uniref:cobalamin biosynthesis protein n=1 Tax=Streptomyces cacaoi TaxID=1898 RepID=UPI00262DC95B|nr:cobalamin biosynthesis protein [Streptomyces cacaoi]